jgi:hypothetical protein
MMRRAFFDPSIESRSSVLRQGLDAHAGAIAHLAAESASGKAPGQEV